MHSITEFSRYPKGLRIFIFMPQRQRMQPNFMNDSKRTLAHTKLLNTRTHNSNNHILQYLYSNSARNWPISYISSMTNFDHFIDSQKSVLSLLSNFVHFIHLYMNPLPTYNHASADGNLQEFRKIHRKTPVLVSFLIK